MNECPIEQYTGQAAGASRQIGTVLDIYFKDSLQHLTPKPQHCHPRYNLHRNIIFRLHPQDIIYILQIKIPSPDLAVSDPKGSWRLEFAAYCKYPS